ncbi:sugar-binding transcriptional regulator [Arcanobacterium bovis]|uniref:Deoxyribonucleoside regulator n=1 Tax=Arcanobacterium bovis TaxID=2529275 RepID=A0A4Q9V240_9ACTO|nr:sugar-binding domain-containing protein [Arcanobacterium bovis]TBW22200.1 deoxyribonucleoside regulator [Arcanobacterium bovis]
MSEKSISLQPRDIQAIDAAKLYYSGMTQAEVADKLHVARPTVSKLLAHAEKRGFIRVQVLDPRERDEMLVDTLIQRYHLLDLILVSPARPDEDSLRQALGQAGAKLLKSLVRDGDMIGVVPSRTVAALADHLEILPRRDVTVVQVSNGLSEPRAAEGQPTTMQRLAHAFGAQCVALTAPTFLGSVAVQNRLMKVPEFRRVLDLAVRARIVLYTVGDIETNRHLIERSPLTQQDREELISRAVGDICSRFVDESGRVCLPDFNNRTLGISLPDLRHKEQKILVAGGSSKVKAIRAALENGYVNRLVTDVDTARAIVQSPSAQSYMQVF